MSLKFILILFLFGETLAVCPPAEDIIPCECNESRLLFRCSQENYPEHWDITAIFDQVTPLIPADFIFESLALENINLETIPAGAIKSLKFNAIFVHHNPNLTYIHPEAFGETTNVTTYLSINDNRLLTNERNEGDVFDVISKFKAATSILIYENGLKSIPDEGFGPLPKLTRFRIDSNPLARIGSRAFSQLPNLISADLNSCDISIEEIAEDAFEGVTSNVEIIMEFNMFTRLPEGIFKPLLENAKLLAVGGQECFWNGADWECRNLGLDCDAESAWLCQDVEKYQPKIKGFFCSGGSETGFESLWDYC